MYVLGLSFERLGLFGGTLKREDWQEEEDEEHGEKERREEKEDEGEKEKGGGKQGAGRKTSFDNIHMASCWLSTLPTRHPKPRRMGINWPRPQTLSRHSLQHLLRTGDKGKGKDFCKWLSLWQLQPGVATLGFSSKSEDR